MAQRHVALFRRPVSAVAKIPVLKHWKKSDINHWAVCVGDICYEVAQTDGPNGHNLLINTRTDWIKMVRQKGLEYEPADLGTCLTSWPDDEINVCANHIWESLFEKKYQHFLWNCQEFALWLLRCIVDNLSEKELTERWESWNPDVLIPATLAGLGAGIGGGALFAGAAAGDVFVSGGVITLTLGTAGLAGYAYKKHQRHKKGRELVDYWHARMHTRPRSKWRRVMDYL